MRSPITTAEALLCAWLAAAAACPLAAAQPSEPGAPALHFLAGMAAGAVGTAAALPALDDLRPPLAAPLTAAAATGAALLIGTLKEINDLRGFGDPSWADLGLTVLGGATTGVLAAAAGALAADQPQARGALSAVALSFAVILSLPVAEGLARRWARRAAQTSGATPSSAPRS